MELFVIEPFTDIDSPPRAAKEGIVAYTFTVIFDILYELNGVVT
jgi:hypothetical protein